LDAWAAQTTSLARRPFKKSGVPGRLHRRYAAVKDMIDPGAIYLDPHQPLR
jgi:hypothetical protein